MKDQLDTAFKSDSYDPIDDHTFGVLMKWCFPGIKKKVTRQHYERGQPKPRTQTCYLGLKEKNIDANATRINLTDVSLQMLPENVYIKKQNSDTLKLQHDTLFFCQGHCVTIEGTISSDGSVLISVGSTEINMEQNFVNPVIDMTLESVKTVAHIMTMLNVCQGFAVSLIPGKMNQNTEIWTGESGKLKMYRSRNCKGTYDALRKMCTSCNSLMKILKKKTKENFTSGFSPQKKKLCSQDSPKKSKPPCETSLVNLENSSTCSPPDTKKSVSSPLPFSVQTPLNSTQQSLIQAQITTSSDWDDTMITHGMTIWMKNPKLYKDMRQHLRLPSERLLQKKKNAVPQNPGINYQNFDWMLQQIKSLHLKKEDLYGGICPDEMSIQPNLSLMSDRILLGHVQMGKEHDIIYEQQNGTADTRLATHVLQFMYNSLKNFRWPLAHYPTVGAQAPDMSEILWDIIRELLVRGVTVLYIVFDGASANRNFLHIVCRSSSSRLPYTMINIFIPWELIAVIMDPKHLHKKIRNNILNSGNHTGSTRLLIWNGCTITWGLFIKAYEWDKKSHAFPVYYSLSDEHLYPNSSDKMRNYLAEDMLNAESLNLLKVYREATGDTSVDALILLLEQTSQLVDVFNDPRPVYDMSDPRLDQLRSVAKWFGDWETEVMSMHLSGKEKARALMSRETREDIQCCVHGFISLCHIATQRGLSVTPSKVNSDITENTFCQQRGSHHGANTHPDYGQYCRGINAIVMSQSTVSKKKQYRWSLWGCQVLHRINPQIQVNTVKAETICWFLFLWAG